MSLEELQELMIKHGAVIRAVPRVVRGICETSHASRFPTGVISYVPEYKRDMLVVDRMPRTGGKFYVESVKNTGNTVTFNGHNGTNCFDTIEEAIMSLESKEVSNEKVLE